MHILIIPSWYNTPAEPIRGSFFRDQALALQKAGHRVGILVPPAKLRSLHGLDEVRHNFRRANTAVTVEDDSGITDLPYAVVGLVALALSLGARRTRPAYL